VTAAHYRIPLLIVVANNRSFFNDELHQERSPAYATGRSRTAGSASAFPSPISTSRPSRVRKAPFGFGPVTAIADLDATFAKAIAAADEGHVVVVDVRVEPGYTAATTAAMTRKAIRL